MKTITLKISEKASAQMKDMNMNVAMVVDTLVSTQKNVYDTKQTHKIKHVKAMSKSGVMVHMIVQVNNASNNHMTVLSLSNTKTKTKAEAVDVTVTLTEEDVKVLYTKKKKKKK